MQKCWLEYFEFWRARLRGLNAFRLQQYLTWMNWILRGLFGSYGGVCTSKTSNLNDLNDLSIEKLIWQGWRGLDFKSIKNKCFECRGAYLRAFRVFRLQLHSTWAFWVFKGLLKKFESICSSNHATWDSVYWVFISLFERLKCWEVWLKPFEEFWVEKNVVWML